MIKSRNKKNKSDHILSLIVFILVIFGLIMISSASVVLSYDKFGNNNYFLIKQIFSAFVGTVLFIIFYAIDYRKLKKISLLALVFVIFLLMLVFLIGFSHGGAKRWLSFGSLFIQPTEIAKLVYILYLAAWLENRREKIRDFKYGLLPFGVITAFIGALIMLQPDLGTATIIAVTAASMYIIAGAGWQQIAVMGLSGFFVLWLLVKSSSYRFARLMVFLNPSADSQGAGYHINQALMAIGSGGILGLGFGLSRQKYNYLPEPMGDSIFAIIAEEMGFVRILILLLLFIGLAYRGFRISRLAPDTFGRLVAFGITSWISLQAAINIAAMASLLPLTGVPLPFISYGGSSLISVMAGMGILLNISKNCTKGEMYEDSNSRWWNRRSRNSGPSGRKRIAGRRR